MDFYDKVKELTLKKYFEKTSGIRLWNLWAKASDKNLKLYAREISQVSKFLTYEEALAKAKAMRAFCQQKIKRAGKRAQPKIKRFII